MLEGLFTNIIKSNGWWKKTNLERLGTTQANETKFGDEKYVVRTEILKKVHEHEIRMDLDAMIQILSHHHEALGVDHLVYPALKRLKALRNRVHLQMLDSDTDHDYNAFDYSINLRSTQISTLYDKFHAFKVFDEIQVVSCRKTYGILQLFYLLCWIVYSNILILVYKAD